MMTMMMTKADHDHAIMSCLVMLWGRFYSPLHRWYWYCFCCWSGFLLVSQSWASKYLSLLLLHYLFPLGRSCRHHLPLPPPPLPPLLRSVLPDHNPLTNFWCTLDAIANVWCFFSRVKGPVAYRTHR